MSFLFWKLARSKIELLLSCTIYLGDRQPQLFSYCDSVDNPLMSRTNGCEQNSAKSGNFISSQ